MEKQLIATKVDHSHNHLFMHLNTVAGTDPSVPATVFKCFTEELITIREDSRPVCAHILVPLKDDDAAVCSLLATARRLFVSRRD